MAEQVHCADGAHGEPIPGRCFVHHRRSHPDHIFRAIERLKPRKTLRRLTPALLVRTSRRLVERKGHRRAKYLVHLSGHARPHLFFVDLDRDCLFEANGLNT